MVLLLLVVAQLLAGVGVARAQGEDWQQGQAVSVTGPTGTGLPIATTPLAPPETSSPRHTLRSYLVGTHEASTVLENALEQHAAEDGFFPSPQVEAQINKVRGLLRHAARTFDLSKVPRATLSRVELESVLLLMEILDRLPTVDLEQVPGDAAVAENPNLLGYTLPGTEIRISLDQTRSYPRRFLFDSETVSRLPSFYRQVKDLPKRDPDRPDLYKAYSISPGELLPSRWFWLIMALPEEFRTVYDDQAVWQWIGLALVSALAILAASFVIRRERFRPRTSRQRRALGRLISPILLLVIGYLYDETVDGLINITGDLSWWIDIGLDVLATFVAIWIVLVVAAIVAEWIISSPKIGTDSLNASLLRVCFRILGIFLGLMILAFGAYSVGLPVVGVVAGLGVGGFALALAIKPTLENFIGFIILYSDRPVRVGERCRLGDIDGVVESIGIRSTRLRKKDGSLVVVQNTDFAQMRLVNMESRDRQELHEILRLSPQTEREQIAHLVDAIEKRLAQEDAVDKTQLHVTFCGIGAYSLDIEISAQVTLTGTDDFKTLRSTLLLEVIRLVEDAGTSLAFMPTGLLSGAEALDALRHSGDPKTSKQKQKEEEEAWKKAKAGLSQQRADLF